jgi:hypothetical protein
MFVFSFADHPSASYFFLALSSWLDEKKDAATALMDPEGIRVSSYDTIKKLARLGGCLLVLDELERIQDTTGRGAAQGGLVDRGMADLFRQVSNGELPNVCMLVTTRFPLAELEEKKPRHFRRIDVEALPVTAAVNLLRRRGVIGNEAALIHAAERFGLHALTIDLVGAYIATFAGGDPNAPVLTDTPSDLTAQIDSEPSFERRRILKQEARLFSIAQTSLEALAALSNASVRLVEVLSFFRMPVPADVLCSVVSLLDLTLTLEQIAVELRRLRELRMVELPIRGLAQGYSVVGTASELYYVHPALRNLVLRRLDETDKKRVHKAIKNVLLGRIEPRTVSYTEDPGTLDLLTEIIFHSAKCESGEDAWILYVDRIGGFTNLGRRMGAYWRGERMCRAFAGDNFVTSLTSLELLPEDAKLLCLYDWGRYLVGCGRLDEARLIFELHNARRVKWGNWLYASLGNLQLSEIALLLGDLDSSLAVTDIALELIKRTASAGLWRDALAYRAFTNFLIGNTPIAKEEFDVSIPDRLAGVDFRLPIEWKSNFLARLGLHGQALELIEQKRELLRSVGGEARYSALSEICACEIEIATDCANFDRQALVPPTAWAVTNDAKESIVKLKLLETQYQIAGVGQKSLIDQRETAESIFNSVNEALRIATDCHFSLLHIDGLLLRARAYLLLGMPLAARRDIHLALHGSLPTEVPTGLLESEREQSLAGFAGSRVFPLAPPKFPACDTRNGYRWAEVTGRRILGQVYLVLAANAEASEGRDRFSNSAKATAPTTAEWLRLAEGELQQSADIAARIEDPTAVEGELLRKAIREDNYRSFATVSRPPTQDAQPEVKIFLSYSHKDKSWVPEIERLLAPSVMKGNLQLWSDTEIDAGPWRQKITKAIETADLAILLVSTAFIASRFINDNELPPLLDRLGHLDRVFWIPISASTFEETPLKDYQAASSPETPLDGMRSAARMKALVNIARKINKAIRAIIEERRMK